MVMMAVPHPIMPEGFVRFYRDYIPFRCAGNPEQEKAALAALARRDQRAIERIINPWPIAP
jgi:hypothetical protein